MDPRSTLLDLFETGVRAVHPDVCLSRYLPDAPPQGRTLVLGAGKAAASMAKSFAEHYSWDYSGFVVTRYGHGVDDPIPDIEVLEASHPVPDLQSQEAAKRMLEEAGKLRQGDRLVFLASGGGSAVLSLPVQGLDFEHKRALVRHLVLSGASIHEINCVRKHISAIKGGRLAQAAGAADVMTYVISDVPGDNPADVASGPTLPDPSTIVQARDILHTYGCPDGVDYRALLDAEDMETPKPSEVASNVHMIATADDCLNAAEARTAALGLDVINLGASIEGEAQAVGRAHADLIRTQNVQDRPLLVLSGGELTVVVKNPHGCGGPNMEYVLSLALALGDGHNVYALSCDTDGIDGSEDAAGGIIDPTSLVRAKSNNIDVSKLLHDNRSYDVLKALNDLVVTGPSRTNVNDFRAILVLPARAA